MQRNKVTYGSSFWRDYRNLVIILFLIGACATLTVAGMVYNPPHKPVVIKYLNYSDGAEYHRVGDTQVYIIINDNGVVSVQEGNRGYSFVIPQVQENP